MQQPPTPKKKVLHNIDSLTNAKTVTEPVISGKRKADLTEKLELEKTALKLVAERNKRNDLMLSYDYNPFRQIGRPKVATSHITPTREKPAPIRTIIDQVNKLTEQPIRQDYYKQSRELVDSMGDLIMLSQKLNGDIDRFSYKFRKE